MTALKTAANAFIDSTAEANQKISENDQKHRISLVTFESSASTRRELTVCDTNNAAALKSTVNGLRANGGTQADDGMRQAQSVLNNAREGAQKVVIFFTDGEPGDFGFTNSVANSAISTAKTLKSGENGALIYSIGMFGDADPSDTSQNFNGYMHGVSSNYPDATAYNNLGQRAEGSDYYKRAADADELNSIFSEIFEEISVIEASSPFTQGAGTDGENMAAITFHDELGDYMKVDDFKAIVFADMIFTDPKVIEAPVAGEDKKIIHYDFTGTAGGNVIYPSGDLAEIEITVERYNDPAKGDVVTVVIPASMVPLREYVVNTIDGQEEMTIDDTFPLRIFYGASLKDEVKTLLSNPDNAMKAYIEANQEDGQVNFYANKYYKDGTNNGGVYVEFTPNKLNDFYYFQEDEILYTGDAPSTEGAEPGNKQIATGNLDTSGDTIYYYDRLYYSLENGKPVEKHNWVQIPGDSNLPLAGFVSTNANGQLYIEKETPRTTSLATHALNKTEASNNTGTASYVTAPNWANINNPREVIVKLGNNGVLPVDLSSSLEISKRVNVIEGDPDPDTEFTFEISLKGDSVKDSYTAQKFNASGQADGAQETIAFEDSKATVTLKDGEKIQIYGLAAGVEYTVTEKNLPKGFTAKDNTNSLNGEIAAGKQSSAAFVNEYTAEKLIIHNNELGLKGTKKIVSTGGVEKVFEVGDIFRFDITASDATNFPSPLPSPSSTTLEVKEDSAFKGKTTAKISFGEFTFTEEGEYRYSIREHLATGAADDKIVPGITYDTTNYRLVLNVEDDGKGQLVITKAEITKNSGAPDDTEWETVYSGTTLPEGDATHLVFENTYEGEQQTISLAARKTMNKLLTDYSGAEQFGFVVEGTEAGQPMPTAASEGAYAGKYVYKNDTTGIITIPGITFTTNDAPDDGSVKEYTYKIRELQPTKDGTVDGEAIDAGATKVDDKWTYKGVTFDNMTKTVKVKVSKTTTGGKEELKVEIDYGNADKTDTPEVDESLPVFTNTYNASVETETITGTKKITGRNFNGTETFTFEIDARNNAPLPVKDGQKLESVTIMPTENTDTAAIDFGVFKFNQDNMIGATKTVTDGHASYEKTFEYIITEEAGSEASMTYDTTPRTLKITVTDDGYGNMAIKKTEITPNTEDKLVWTNAYSSSMKYNDGKGLNISKTLTGRNMKAGEFEFTITPKTGTDTPELATDGKFVNGASADGRANVMNKLAALTFDQDDAGKTFTYIIDETEPANDDSETAGIQKNGVTYDQSQYQVEIKVTDNGQGTLSAETAVTRIMSATGTVLDTPESVDVDKIAFANSYKAGTGTLTGATNLQVTKSFTGRENNQWLNDDSFTFKIKLDTENLPEGVNETDVTMPDATSITINADNTDKTASFGDITFTKAGTYVFTVSEDTTGLAAKGITISDSEKIIKVVVADGGNGTLQAVVDNTSDQLYFENVYKAEKTSFTGISVEKIIDGRNWNDDDSFDFTLTAGDTTTDSAITNCYVELPNPATVTIDSSDVEHKGAFGAITFDKAGTYVFNVTEQAPESANDLVYDTAPKKVTIVVTDDGNGTLTAKVKTEGEAGVEVLEDTATVTVTNTYSPDASDPVSTTGLFTKAISGRDWISTTEFTDVFKFTITPQDGAPAPSNRTVTVTSATAKANDKVAFDFGTITFTKADMGGQSSKTFTYKISEDRKGTTDDSGMTYSDHEATMTITVTDNGTGKLTAGTPTVDDGNFVNTYKQPETPKVEVTVNGTKMLKKDGAPDEQKAPTAGSFSFGLKDETGTVVQTASNDAEGKFSFKQTFTEAKTYKYTVSEVIGTDTSITAYDQSEYQIEIVVSENDADGTLSAVTTITKVKDENGIEIDPAQVTTVGTTDFVNTYAEPVTPTAAASIEGVKELLNEEGQQQTLTAGRFTFELKDADGNSAGTAYNQADGRFSFPLSFTSKGTYNYTVTETNTGEDGITYDDSSFAVSVTVEEDADGKLTAAVNYPADGIKFTNTCESKPVDPPTPSRPENGSISLTAKKILSGRDLAAGEFSFAVVDANGRTVATGSNKADGTIDFSRIIFTEAGIYEYDVKEINNNLGGVTYDDTLYHVQVIVQNIGGKLTPTSVQYQIVSGQAVSALVFNNVYKAGETGLSIGGTKILEGRKLKAGEFTFVLKDENGKTYKVVNDADGQFIFDQLVFDKAGTYVYSLYEQKGKDKEITYDGEEFLITVTVTDDLKGNLNASYVVTKDGKEVDAVAFTNTYEKAEEPDKPVTPDDPEDPDRPKTGDESGLALWTVLLILAAGAVPAVNAARKKAERK